MGPRQAGCGSTWQGVAHFARHSRRKRSRGNLCVGARIVATAPAWVHRGSVQLANTTISNKHHSMNLLWVEVPRHPHHSKIASRGRSARSGACDVTRNTRAIFGKIASKLLTNYWQFLEKPQFSRAARGMKQQALLSRHLCVCVCAPSCARS